MLEIEVTLKDSYDESTSTFGVLESRKVQLEHSLFSLAKWEAAWGEPFLSKKDKTSEQTLSYIRMMILEDDFPPEVFQKLLNGHLKEIQDYINAPMSATKLPQSQTQSTTRESITAELIYYWMAELQVPLEFQHWHLTRLFTTIQVFHIKKTPPKKMTQADRRKLNRSRLAQHRTRG
jgi:hypothetical protein